VHLRGWRAVLAVAVAVPLGLASACTHPAAPPPRPPTAPTTPAAPATAPTARAAPPALTDAHNCTGLPGFTCSFLTVPLDRSGAVPGTLRLQVAAAGNTGAPHGTLLFLTGGPGQPGVPFVGQILKALPQVARGYRLVMIDQRGTGAGSLDCPELQGQMGESDTVPPTPAAVQACAQALGIRRDFFTTADTVEDLDELRQALHLASWTLDGVSYGTFTAEQYALTYPDRVRRLVLDSSVTQQNADPLYVASMHRAAFVLRQACQEQHCGYDPAAKLASVIDRYGYAVRLFDILVILSIIDPHLRSQNIAFLPRLHQAAAGNPGPLRSLITGFYAGPPVMPQVYSSALHAATLCADLTDMPWGNAATPLSARAAALQRAVQRIPAAATWPFPVSTAAGQGIMQECRYWPPARPDPPPPNRTLTMPVLLLAGTLDLSTPLPWAQQEAAQIPHATLVVIPGSGHATQLASVDGAAAAQRFLLA
jgi:pimeloyl-ACP methyl ester carboxylesterase